MAATHVSQETHWSNGRHTRSSGVAGAWLAARWVADNTLIYPSTINDANSTIAAGGTLRVSAVKVGGNAQCSVMVTALRRS